MAFQLEAQIDPAYCPSVRIYKWRSPRTGLQVVLLKRPSPSVQGYFAVASEANDNSGCPHTLEHIVFLGSQQYPYKGLLDLLSTKEMSTTNAWTGQDQTCYTLVSAGYEGFLTLLPVYIDHILHATVDESACVTEVYHIDGNGEEKGVVFSEMQGYEHESASLVEEEVQRLLYAPGSGYATNTGGNLGALRALDSETIAAYHRAVYRPSNLSVIVSGDIEPELLMAEMERIDATLEDDARLPRPFVDSDKSNQPSPLAHTEISEIVFPDSAETAGEVNVSWIGPHVAETVHSTALEVVLMYLTRQSVGKLQRAFVDVRKEDALAAEASFYVNPFLHARPELAFYGVPYERLREAGEKLVGYLDDRLLPELDFASLRQCIENLHDQFIHSAENNWETLIELALSDFIYGDRTQHTFEEWLGSMAEFDTLRGWTDEQWREYITKYFVDVPKACVVAKPSRDEYTRIEQEKAALSAEIKRTKNLKECGERLERAIQDHERPIPEDILDQFAAPDVAKIRFIHSKTAATRALTNNLPGSVELALDPATQALLDPAALANCLAVNFESIASQFVSVQLFISPEHVDKRLYPLIDVVLANVFAMPMQLDDGRRLSAEEVAQEVKRDALFAYMGAYAVVPETITLKVTTKLANYALAVEWIKRALFNVIFDPERVAIFVARHLKSVAEYKRSEMSLLNSEVDAITLTDGSVSRQVDVLITEDLVKEYESDIAQTARDTQLLAQQLCRADQIRAVVIGDVPQLANVCGGNILQPFADLEARLAPAGDGAPGSLARVATPHDFISPKGEYPGREAYLILCAATDTCYVKSVAAGPSAYGHADLPALTLAREYIGMTEGPYWTAVRGPGLAYGARNSNSVQSGLVSCLINSAANPLGALEACATVVRDLVAGKLAVTEEDLQQAVALTVNSLAETLAQPLDAATEKFLDTVVKGYEPDYVHRLISDIKKVSVADFLRVVEQYYLPLFDAQTSTMFMVSPPSEKDKLEQALTEAGYEVSVREVEVDSDDEDDDEEDDEDEESYSESE